MKDISNKEVDDFEEKIKVLYDRLQTASDNRDMDAILALKADINNMIAELDIEEE